MTNTALANHLAQKRSQVEASAQTRVDFELALEEARLQGVSVLPGQKGVEYHFSVVRRDGMYYDAYDLQDAQVMADNLAVHLVSLAKVVRNSDGRVMSYHSYSDAKSRRAA